MNAAQKVIDYGSDRHVWRRIVTLVDAGHTVTITKGMMPGEFLLVYDDIEGDGGGHHHISSPERGGWVF